MLTLLLGPGEDAAGGSRSKQGGAQASPWWSPRCTGGLLAHAPGMLSGHAAPLPILPSAACEEMHE